MSDRPVTLSEERNTFYPVLKTNRISLSQIQGTKLKINIDYSLNLIRPRNTGRDDLADFLNSRQGVNHVKICFMVLDERNKSLVRDLATRKSLKRTVMNLEFDPRFAILEETNGLHKVLLRDSLIQSRDNINYTSTSEMASEVHYETCNTLQIEYDMRSNQALQRDPGLSIFSREFADNLGPGFLESLHLVGYLELPYAELESTRSRRAYELTNLPITEITYDLLLEQEGTLRAPAKRQIFFVEDPGMAFEDINLRPYSGPAFFDMDLSTWRAGTTSEDGGPRLAIRSVRNTKIHIDSPPIAIPSSILPVGPQGIHSANPTGQDLEGFINSLPSGELFLNPEKKIKMMIKNSIRSSMMNNQTFIEPWSRVSKWISKDQNLDDEMLDSSYNCIIGLKYFDLLKRNSPLSDLIQHHYDNLENTNMSRDILEAIYNSSRILNLSVIRRRVTSRPFSHNDLDSKVYSNFETNQINKVIIEASDPPSEPWQVVGINHDPRIEADLQEVNFFPDEDLGPKGQEMVVQAMDITATAQFENRLTRCFVLRDYELFYNIDLGKYTYDVEILFQDGSKKILETYLTTLRTIYNLFMSQVNRISIPVSRDSMQRRTGGYYDYYSKRFFFSDNDSAMTNGFVSSVEAILDATRWAIFFITGVDVAPRSENPGDESVFSQIVNKMDIRLQTTTLGDIEFFAKKVKDVIVALDIISKDIFSKSGISSKNSTEKIHVPNSTGNNSSIIRAKTKTNVIHDAEDTTRMLADYGMIFSNLASNDLASFIQNARVRAAFANLRRGDNSFQTDVDLGALAESDRVLDINDVSDVLTRLAADDSLFQPAEFSILVNRRLQMETTPSMLTSDVFSRVSRAALSSEQLQETENKGHVYQIRNEEFQSLSKTQKSIREMRVLTMMQQDSHLLGFSSKSSSFDHRFLNSSISGTSQKFTGFDSGKSMRDLASSALKISAVDTSLLSVGLRSALLDAIVVSKDGDDFAEKIENNFKELTSIRSAMKDTFEIFIKLSSYSNINIPSKFYNQSSKDVYENGKIKDKTAPLKELRQDPFANKVAAITSVTKSGNIKIMPNQSELKNMLQLSASTNNKIKKVKLFKLEPRNNDDNLSVVNNGLLMEIK
tara:strand:+ start:8159 stop:11512 length:3354 start_codon:yes stop_codon:yes gene_type:complete